MSREPPRDISQAELIQVAEAARAGPPAALPAAVDEVAQRILGHGLMTVMRFHPETMELERLYSSQPSYPLGGRKSKRGPPWANQVLVRGEVFIGSGPDEMRWAFDDHEKLAGLGLGSVINTPVLFAGRCLGTFNLLHGAGWYRQGDEATTRLLAFLLTPFLLMP